MNDVFIHPHALCESKSIGSKTRVWAFAHVLPKAVIGSECNVCDHVFIENDVRVGDRVTIKCGVQLWDGIELEDDVFIGPNVTFTNDPFPRSKQYPDAFPRTYVRRGASIGANATILPGITIGARAMIGAGSVVTRDVPPNAIVKGNPARVTGFVDAGPVPEVEKTVPVMATRARVIPLGRGHASSVPFSASRVVVLEGANATTSPLGARTASHRFLVCTQGSLRVAVSDGTHRDEVVLSPANGLHIPPQHWAETRGGTPDVSVVVLESAPPTDEAIESWEFFLATRKNAGP
jgi:UDP-2-acetamido-3-amino-2,3-dideoxy-glucuronate N-acetyltransferase